MPNYIAFLRGINLGKRRLKMDDLRTLVAQLPFTEVETFIASGNVVFGSNARDTAKLERTLADHLEKSLGYEVDVFIRTRAEIASIVTHAPLGELWSEESAASTQVTLQQTPLPASTVAKLDAWSTEHDAFAVIGRELFWRCRTRMSDSTVWKEPEIKALKIPVGTTRNLNTLRKLAELYPA